MIERRYTTLAGSRSRIRFARLSLFGNLFWVVVVCLSLDMYRYAAAESARSNGRSDETGIAARHRGFEPTIAVARPSSPHPLDPELALLASIPTAFERDVSDYTAKLIKRERIRGKLGEPEELLVKIRCPRVDPDGRLSGLHVYVRFEAPKGVAGREVIWIEGKNDGKMSLMKVAGSIWLPYNWTRMNTGHDGQQILDHSNRMGKLLHKLIEKGNVIELPAIAK